MGPTKRGKGTKVMAVADASGLPVAIDIASASPHGITLVEPLLDRGCFTDAPERLIGDRAYDSDKHDARLAERGIELISPHRKNRKRPAIQDGRSCDATSGGGKLSVSLPGCRTFAAYWCVTNITRTITWVFCVSAVSSSFYAIYEIASSLIRLE